MLVGTDGIPSGRDRWSPEEFGGEVGAVDKDEESAGGERRRYEIPAGRLETAAHRSLRNEVCSCTMHRTGDLCVWLACLT